VEEDLKNNFIIKPLITWLCDCVCEVVHWFVSNIIMLREAIIGPALYRVFLTPDCALQSRECPLL
jgi:hypothetical protein